MTPKALHLRFANEPRPLVNATDRDSAEGMRAVLLKNEVPPAVFRAALTQVAAAERDGWLNAVLGIESLADDGPELPRDCVAYLPCSVDAILRLVAYAEVGPADVFVDIGSGVGRAAALVHLLTGAASVGIEIQSELVAAARALTSQLKVQVSTVGGDAAELTGHFTSGSVFFLYCPFGGERLQHVLAQLERIARTKEIRVCCVDVPLLVCAWLTLVSSDADLAVYRSTTHGSDNGLLRYESW